MNKSKERKQRDTWSTMVLTLCRSNCDNNGTEGHQGEKRREENGRGGERSENKGVDCVLHKILHSALGPTGRGKPRQISCLVLTGTGSPLKWSNGKWRQREQKHIEKLTGPMMVACQWNKSSPMGPAEQDEGGSLPRSANSYCSQKHARKEKVVCHQSSIHPTQRDTERETAAGYIFPQQWRNTAKNKMCWNWSFEFDVKPPAHFHVKERDRQGIAQEWCGSW